MGKFNSFLSVSEGRLMQDPCPQRHLGWKGRKKRKFIQGQIVIPKLKHIFILGCGRWHGKKVYCETRKECLHLVNSGFGNDPTSAILTCPVRRERNKHRDTLHVAGNRFLTKTRQYLLFMKKEDVSIVFIGYSLQFYEQYYKR